MKSILTLFITFAILIQYSWAQHDLEIGQWRSFLPYTTGKYVTQTPTEVWYAADRSILILDKGELSSNTFDKVDGLSDVNPRLVKYSPTDDLVLITYENSNIDIVSSDRNEIENINDIKRNLALQGDKTIYDIHFYNKNAYLATGFGLVQIDIAKAEIKSTVFTDTKVNTVTNINNTLYIATDIGVFFLPIEDNTNIQDFSQWQKLDEEEGFPNNYKSRVVYGYKDGLYLDVHDSLFVYQQGQLQFLLAEKDFSVGYINEGQNRLIIQLQQFPFYGQKIYLKADDNISPITLPSWCLSGSGSSAVEDQDGRIWFADFGKRIRRYNTQTDECITMTFNSPFSASNHRLFVSNNELWIAAGSITAAWQYGLNTDGVSHLNQNQEWTLYNRDNVAVFKDMYDITDIAVNPKDNKVYMASLIRGLYIWNGETMEVFNHLNSPLQGGDAPENVRIPGIAIDDNGNVWMGNNNTQNPIAMRAIDGTWQTFPATQPLLATPTIDDEGYKWFTTSNRGVVVFHEGEELSNHTDNNIRYITPNNSQLPTEIVFDIATDKDGEVWVGTAEGVVIFDCGTDAFSNDCQGTKRIVQREDGNNAYLLESENVRSITVDPANRKWIGTTNGVFLLSADGLEEIHHFTTDNSPLFSNIINDIAINETTGEVFIGTNDGIVSYQSDAVVGKFGHASHVYAFPNPVEPDYKGPIAIRGLPQDASVKITNITGQLVYETTALGGQAIWYGEDQQGNKVASGVYLVFSVNENNLTNPEGKVTKILILN